MPRKNKRKIYTTGKPAVFFGDRGNAGYKPECVGCAFAGYGGTCTTSGGTCTTSDGACLKTVRPPYERIDADAVRKR